MAMTTFNQRTILKIQNPGGGTHSQLELFTFVRCFKLYLMTQSLYVILQRGDEAGPAA
jgi:hypothetical protein